MTKRCFLAVAFCCAFAALLQAQQRNDATFSPSFKEIVPSLHLMNSGYPTTSDLEKDTLVVTRDKEAKVYKFVGKVITTDDLLKETNIQIAICKEQPASTTSPQYQWQDNKTIESGSLTIYCDSFVLNQTLWLPGWTVDIQARVINMNNLKIDASALPWRRSVDFSLVIDNVDYEGKEGKDGGDITINCENILKRSTISSNGSAGESTFFPKVTITPAKSHITEIKLYKMRGADANCDVQPNSSAKGGNVDWDLKGYKCVAAIYENYSKAAFYDEVKCFGYELFSDDIEWKTKNEFNSVVYDKKEMERITYDTTIIFGKGGNAGQITINIAPNSPTLQASSCVSTGGWAGYYLSPANTPTITFGEYRKVMLSAKITPLYYYVYGFKNHSNAIGYLSTTNYGSKSYIEIPSYSAINRFNDRLSNSRTGKFGQSTSAAVSQKAYLPHLEYFEKRFLYLQTQYFAYYKKNEAERKVLDTEIADLVAALATINAAKNIPQEEQATYSSLYLRALDWNSQKTRNLDEFNNPPGFRPMYSLGTTLEYMETNLKTDLELYIMADIMASNETKAKDFLKKVGGMIDNLKKSNQKIVGQLQEENKVYSTIATEAVTCQKQTDDIKKDLAVLERKLRADAKGNIERMKWVKTSMKIAAVAASVIPYGQPVLGQVVGNGLNSLADNLKTRDNDPQDLALGLMNDIDLSGTMEALSKKSFKAPKDPALTRKPVEVELTKDEKEDAKYAIDLAKYDAKVAKRNETLTTVADGSKKILSEHLKYSVTESDLNNEIAALQKESTEFTDISRKLRIQAELKGKIFKKLTTSIGKITAKEAALLRNEAAAFKLQDKADITQYNAGLQAALFEIRDAAFNRLKWIEYQLIKSYEYTTLDPYKTDMLSVKIVQELKERKKGLTLDSIDAVVKHFSRFFDAQKQDIGKLITDNEYAKLFKTEEGFQRNIVLVTDNTTNLNATKLLDEANQKGYCTIDLQKDLINEVIRPDETHNRIRDIELREVDFEGGFPDNASYKVVIEILDEGIMRQGKDLLLFRSGDATGVARTWEWTLNKRGGKVKPERTAPSKEYQEVLKFFIYKDSQKPIEGWSTFSLPPAWSKCKIQIIPLAGIPTPKIKKFNFGLQCDFRQIPSESNDANNVVLDVKMKNAPFGTSFTVAVDGKTTKHNSLFYGVLDKNKQVTLQVDELTDGNGPRFDEVPDSLPKFAEWLVTDIYGKFKSYPTKKLSIDLTEHQRVVAIFQKVDKTNTSQAKVDMVDVYEKPSDQSPKLMRCPLDEVIKLDEPKDSNGFIHVSYNGVQEGYIKQ